MTEYESIRDAANKLDETWTAFALLDESLELYVVKDQIVAIEERVREAIEEMRSAAEIVYAARREMALKLSDALIRRTSAGSAGHPGSDALERAAAIMARAHGWDTWRTQNEIAEVEAFYRLPRD